MKIELNEPWRLKIILDAREMREMFKSFDDMSYSNSDTRETIWELLDEAYEETGFEADGGRLLIEAIPLYSGGCILYFTRIENEKDIHRQKKQLRKQNEWFVYEFNAETLLGAVLALKNLPESGCRIFDSKLYFKSGVYMLILSIQENWEDPIDAVLSEYGSLIGEGSAFAAFISEHSESIVEGNAVKYIAAHL